MSTTESNWKKVKETDLTPEEQARIKVSFADGYMAGRGARPNRMKKYFGFLQNFLTITILGFFAFYIIGGIGFQSFFFLKLMCIDFVVLRSHKSNL